MAGLLLKLINSIRSQSDNVHTALAIGATSALIPAVSSLSPTPLLTTGLVSMAAGFGTKVWVSSVAGPTMFMNMPKSAFGDIQSRLFPKYAMLLVSSGMIGLASHYYTAHGIDLCTQLLAANVATNILQAILIIPVTTSYMYKRRKAVEGTDEFKSAAKMFGMCHGVSVLINMGSMVIDVYYFYLLASRMTGVC